MEEKRRRSGAKWEGKVTARLTKATADQIWPLFKDFFNLHTYYPSLPICYGVHGTNGEIGCIRCCSGFSISSSAADGGESRWTKERLISIDESERSLSYEIVESNIGFESYVSTVKIEPDDDGCVIEWGFTVDPVEGLALDGVAGSYESALLVIAKTMEDALVSLN